MTSTVHGCRDLARAHTVLQRELAELREYLDEATEVSTNHIADEALDALRRLTLAARHVRARAERIEPRQEHHMPHTDPRHHGRRAAG